MKYKIIYDDGETFEFETNKDLDEALCELRGVRWGWIRAIIKVDW